MPKTPYEPCIPTRGTKVPTGPDWLHEIKYDGYRIIVKRQGKRVGLFTRNGHDWTNRYPLIVESALRNKAGSFVIDGEAVLLGVDELFTIDSGASITPRLQPPNLPKSGAVIGMQPNNLIIHCRSGTGL
jgi:hypothetical protein